MNEWFLLSYINSFPGD